MFIWYIYIINHWNDLGSILYDSRNRILYDSKISLPLCSLQESCFQLFSIVTSFQDSRQWKLSFLLITWFRVTALINNRFLLNNFFFRNITFKTLNNAKTQVFSVFLQQRIRLTTWSWFKIYFRRSRIYIF